jgi:hypothetical protein
MKAIPGQEMLKIIQKIHFSYLEIGKQRLDGYFGKNRKIKILHF